jgi:hypothetical protein
MLLQKRPRVAVAQTEKHHVFVAGQLRGKAQLRFAHQIVVHLVHRLARARRGDDGTQLHKLVVQQDANQFPGRVARAADDANLNLAH